MKYHKLVYIIIAICTIIIANACQESIEERAFRDSQEYTRKFCPTPPENDVITDGLVFDRSTRTQIYYMTFTGQIDDPQAIKENEDKLRLQLLETIRQNTSLNTYKKNGFNFRYVCRSKRENGKIILDIVYTEKDYNK